REEARDEDYVGDDETARDVVKEFGEVISKYAAMQESSQSQSRVKEEDTFGFWWN
ncbi:unnamed protein product, partial [Amoebophrya sp. A25]